MDYKKSIYFCLGLGATSPLLALVVGGRVLSLMTLSLVLVIIDLIITKKDKIKLERNNLLYTSFMAWMLISILSCVFGFVYFANNPIDYSISTIKYIPKILLYVFLTILLINTKNKHDKTSYLLKGIYCGIALNIVWSIIDAGLYYTIHKSLTNSVFKAYITATDMHYGVASIEDGFSIRSVGLNNDPATIGFFATVGSSYGFVKRKFWIVLICIVACFASVSFVGLVGIAIISLYHLAKAKRLITPKYLVIMLILVILMGRAAYNLINNDLFESVKTALELRASSKMEGDHSSETRMLFIEKYPYALLRMPITLIIGTGYSTAVYPYYQEGLDYGGEEFPTHMENTYIDNFFSFGLIGFIFFIIFYSEMFLLSRKYVALNRNNMEIDLLYSISLGSLISYAFYHYTLYSVIMLSSIAGIVYFKKSLIIKN